MTLRIDDTAMTSDRTAHTARHAPGRNGWEVSWRPGQTPDRDTAITAMILAGTAAEPDLRQGHRLWPHLQGRAEQAGLTASAAIARVSAPRGDTSHQHERAGRHPDRQAAGRTARHSIQTSAVRPHHPSGSSAASWETPDDSCMRSTTA